jgi:hypothetical protein
VSGFTEKGSKGKVEMWCSKIYEERKRSSFCLYKKETGPFAYLTMAQTEKEKTLGGYSRACVNCTVEVSSCNKAYQNVTRIRPTNCGGKAYGRRSTRLTRTWFSIIDQVLEPSWQVPVSGTCQVTWK